MPAAERKRIGIILTILLGYLGLGAVLAFVFPKVGHHILPFMSGLGLALPIVANTRRKSDPPETLGPGETFPMTLALTNRRGVATGKDQGHLIFSEGWLLFEGARTAFALTRAEGAGWTDSRVVRFTLADGRGAVFSLPPNSPSSDRLKAAYYVWSGMSIPKGEAVLPPVEIHPAVRAERWSLAVVGLVVCVPVAALGLFFAFWPLAILATLGATASLAGARRCARRLRDDLTHIDSLAARTTSRPALGTLE